MVSQELGVGKICVGMRWMNEIWDKARQDWIGLDWQQRPELAMALLCRNWRCMDGMVRYGAGGTGRQAGRQAGRQGNRLQ
jgi:hypothetical protein